MSTMEDWVKTLLPNLAKVPYFQTLAKMVSFAPYLTDIGTVPRHCTVGTYHPNVFQVKLNLSYFSAVQRFSDIALNN